MPLQHLGASRVVSRNESGAERVDELLAVRGRPRPAEERRHARDEVVRDGRDRLQLGTRLDQDGQRVGRLDPRRHRLRAFRQADLRVERVRDVSKCQVILIPRKN